MKIEPIMKYMTAAQAVQLIESGDSICIQGSTSIPEVLSQALADRGTELRGVTVYAAFAVGRCEAPYCKPEYKDAFNVKSLFVANVLQKPGELQCLVSDEFAEDRGWRDGGDFGWGKFDDVAQELQDARCFSICR